MTVPTWAELDAMTPREIKTLETRLRRAAARQRLRLEKSRQRDPHGADYGTYGLLDAEHGTIHRSAGPNTPYGLNLIEVACELYGYPEGDLRPYGFVS